MSNVPQAAVPNQNQTPNYFPWESQLNQIKSQIKSLILIIKKLKSSGNLKSIEDAENAKSNGDIIDQANDPSNIENPGFCIKHDDLFFSNHGSTSPTEFLQYLGVTKPMAQKSFL